jgi:(E)-4-hydroxy-3-methylbut-2-enyl-diphosphate synthase
MGCGVNGPGEARGADGGLSGGKGEALLFRKGQIVRKVPEHQMVEALINEVHTLLNEQGRQDP